MAVPGFELGEVTMLTFANRVTHQNKAVLQFYVKLLGMTRVS